MHGKQKGVADSSQVWVVLGWVSLAVALAFAQWMIWSLEEASFETKRLYTVMQVLALTIGITQAKQDSDEDEADMLERKKSDN